MAGALGQDMALLRALATGFPTCLLMDTVNIEASQVERLTCGWDPEPCQHRVCDMQIHKWLGDVVW